MWAKVKPHVYTVYCVFLLVVAGVLTNKSVENYLDWRFSNPVSLPKNLVIEHHDWVVVETDYMWSNWYGYTGCDFRVITISRATPDWQKAETLFHEIQHAITCDTNGDVRNELFNNPDAWHTGIYWSSPRLVAVLANNPQVSRYIERYGKKDDDGPPPTAIPLFTLSTLPGTPIAGPASRPVSGHHRRKAK